MFQLRIRDTNLKLWDTQTFDYSMYNILHKRWGGGGGGGGVVFANPVIPRRKFNVRK